MRKLFISYQIPGNTKYHSIVCGFDELQWKIDGSLDHWHILDLLHKQHNLTYDRLSKDHISSDVAIISMNELPNVSNK